MPLKETSSQILNVGDRVKMNIKVIGEGEFPMVLGQCEEGVPSPELVKIWLNSKPETMEAHDAEKV